MTRITIAAALVAVFAAASGAAATPYPGTSSRIQDNADQMSLSAPSGRDGIMTTGVQTFGAPAQARAIMIDADASSTSNPATWRQVGTSSDHFQDNADIN